MTHSPLTCHDSPAREATGEKQWTQSQISGTPVRLMDDAGNITGGMVWTREGQKAAGENDSAYPFGWNSERFAGGAPASGGLPFMVGAYLTALHRGIPFSLAPTWILPELSLPSASNQAVFSVRQTPLLPSAVWSEVLGVDGKEPTPPSGPSVDGASTTDCLWCCVEEGTTKKWLKNLPRPVCPSGLPAKIVGEEQIMKHTGERKCLVSCPKKKGKAVVWEAHWAGATGKEAEKAKHCCNSGGCCPLVADCGACQAVFSCASGKWEPVGKTSRAFRKGPFGIGGWHLECPGFCVTRYAPSLGPLGRTVSCLVVGKFGYCIVTYSLYILISAKCAEAVIGPPQGYTPKCGALIPTCEVRNVTPHAKCDCAEDIKLILEAIVHGCKYIPCVGN